MLPYGIIVKQNRLAMQKSYIIWQRKYGLLRAGKFIASAVPFVSVFAVLYCAASILLEKEFSVLSLICGMLFNALLVIFIMYSSAVRTVKDYVLTAKEEKVQLVLTEESLEITTEFSKEIVPYNEIDLCYEKDFLLTVITDKHNFPLSVSKVHFVKGSYDMFVSLLKSRIPGRYEKRGEN